MSGNGPLLGHAEILAFLNSIANDDALTGVRHDLVVVGGSYMALTDLRDTTRDIDAVNLLDPVLAAVVRSHAARAGLDEEVVNASAAPFAPPLPPLVECTVLIDHPNLRVILPPPEYVFLMKLNASRPGTDQTDMTKLLGRCRWTSVGEIVNAFYDAYPNEVFDEYLGEYIADKARAAGVQFSDLDRFGTRELRPAPHTMPGDTMVGQNLRKGRPPQPRERRRT
jgi:hypothetical protein